MTYRVPPLTGECCHCEACVVAGVSDKPVVRSPDGELHGKRLADFYRRKAEFDEAMARNKPRRMTGGE